MKFSKKLIAVPAIALAMALGAAGTALAASAAPVATSVHHPASVVVGRDVMNGSALDYIAHLQWSHWGSTYAYAHGTFYVAIPPYYLGRFSRYGCTITLWRVRSGNFTRMTLRYYHGWNRAYTYIVKYRV